MNAQVAAGSVDTLERVRHVHSDPMHVAIAVLRTNADPPEEAIGGGVRGT